MRWSTEQDREVAGSAERSAFEAAYSPAKKAFSKRAGAPMCRRSPGRPLGGCARERDHGPSPAAPCTLETTHPRPRRASSKQAQSRRSYHELPLRAWRLGRFPAVNLRTEHPLARALSQGRGSAVAAGRKGRADLLGVFKNRVTCNNSTGQRGFRRGAARRSEGDRVPGDIYLAPKPLIRRRQDLRVPPSPDRPVRVRPLQHRDALLFHGRIAALLTNILVLCAKCG